MRERKEAEAKGSNGGHAEKPEHHKKIPRRDTRGRERALQAKRAEQVMKNEVREKLKKDKTEDTAKHGAVGSDRGVGKRQSDEDRGENQPP